MKYYSKVIKIKRLFVHLVLDYGFSAFCLFELRLLDRSNGVWKLIKIKIAYLSISIIWD